MAASTSRSWWGKSWFDRGNQSEHCCKYTKQSWGSSRLRVLGTHSGQMKERKQIRKPQQRWPQSPIALPSRHFHSKGFEALPAQPFMLLRISEEKPWVPLAEISKRENGKSICVCGKWEAGVDWVDSRLGEASSASRLQVAFYHHHATELWKSTYLNIPNIWKCFWFYFLWQIPTVTLLMLLYWC